MRRRCPRGKGGGEGARTEGRGRAGGESTKRKGERDGECGGWGVWGMVREEEGDVQVRGREGDTLHLRMFKCGE